MGWKTKVRLISRYLSLLLAGFYLYACSASPAISEPIVTTRIPARPTVAVENSVLYRQDIGRRGVYYQPAIRNLGGVIWQRDFDEDAYFPVYANGTLYIGTSSGKLLALDPDSGDERWSFAAESGPILAVAVSQGLIYFGAGDTGFYAVEAETGTLSWAFEADSSVWSGSPLIMAERVYFGSDRGTVYCLDLETHNVIWTFRAASGVLSQMAGDEQRVYVPTQAYLYALDATTGTEVWRAATQDKWNEPAVSKGVVYAGRGNLQFAALDAGTGQEHWVFTAPMSQWSEWSAPVITEDSVYVGDSNNTMYSLDRATGEIQWQFKTEDWATTAPILTDGVLYFGVGAHANLVEATEDRPFYALDAGTGEALWTFKADGPVYAGATLGNGMIYFKTLNNVLYALQ
jgi:eukaryotic-like serine/threonine-protein kinase